MSKNKKNSIKEIKDNELLNFIPQSFIVLILLTFYNFLKGKSIKSHSIKISSKNLSLESYKGFFKKRFTKNGNRRREYLTKYYYASRKNG